MPWLKKWNPIIDWVAKRIFIPRPIGRRDVAPLHECLPSWTDSLAPQRYILQWLGMDTDLKTVMWKISIDKEIILIQSGPKGGTSRRDATPFGIDKAGFRRIAQGDLGDSR